MLESETMSLEEFLLNTMQTYPTTSAIIGGGLVGVATIVVGIVAPDDVFGTVVGATAALVAVAVAETTKKRLTTFSSSFISFGGAAALLVSQVLDQPQPVAEPTPAIFGTLNCEGGSFTAQGNKVKLTLYRPQ